MEEKVDPEDGEDGIAVTLLSELASLDQEALRQCWHAIAPQHCNPVKLSGDAAMIIPSQPTGLVLDVDWGRVCVTLDDVRKPEFPVRSCR
jgi:hypothetical protein